MFETDTHRRNRTNEFFFYILQRVPCEFIYTTRTSYSYYNNNNITLVIITAHAVYALTHSGTWLNIYTPTHICLLCDVYGTLIACIAVVILSPTNSSQRESGAVYYSLLINRTGDDDNAMGHEFITYVSSHRSNCTNFD